LNNYRQRGYRLALSGVSSTPDLNSLLALQPNILKLRPKEGREGLDVASSAGIATELSGIESGQDFVLACTAGMDFGQGSLFGLPQADCLPTHSRRRVAYNSRS
jgi:EAL domain-containing protein (putative c-di-GMP-specific phosphodiesterase class I)